MADTVMVRLPGELAERIKATGQKREPFVRQAVEAALGGPKPTSPAPPRASAPAVERRPSAHAKTRTGCRLHPRAGATEHRGKWWCAEPGCSRPALWAS